jgi:hypothetical protein
MDEDRIETHLPTTIELDALHEDRLIEVPIAPELEPLDHDAHGGWPQYAAGGHEFDHTAEEVADQDLVAQDRAERGLDSDFDL